MQMVDDPFKCAPARERYISLLGDPRLTERERAFGAYVPGRWAWMTAAASRVVLAEPIPMRGAQGLRELAPDLAEQLARATAAPARGDR
jgi:hypothetical protein